MPWTEQDKNQIKDFEDELLELVNRFERKSGINIKVITFEKNEVEGVGNAKTRAVITAEL